MTDARSTVDEAPNAEAPAEDTSRIAKAKAAYDRLRREAFGVAVLVTLLAVGVFVVALFVAALGAAAICVLIGVCALALLFVAALTARVWVPLSIVLVLAWWLGAFG